MTTEHRDHFINSTEIISKGRGYDRAVAAIDSRNARSSYNVFSCRNVDQSLLTYTGASQKRAEFLMHELDTCGLDCPMPLLKAKQALNKLPSGELLRVTATDPGSQRDFRVFAEQSGHQLIETSEQNGVFFYVLKKR
ncbi:MAG: response regulator SirA [Verrucomicrobiaceae bacterium]|nr:response regulator SirA [Verrucomicrobiaceae bacterium]